MIVCLSCGEGNRVGHILGTGYKLWLGRRDTFSEVALKSPEPAQTF